MYATYSHQPSMYGHNVLLLPGTDENIKMKGSGGYSASQYSIKCSSKVAIKYTMTILSHILISERITPSLRINHECMHDT